MCLKNPKQRNILCMPLASSSSNMMRTWFDLSCSRLFAWNIYVKHMAALSLKCAVCPQSSESSSCASKTLNREIYSVRFSLAVLPIWWEFDSIYSAADYLPEIFMLFHCGRTDWTRLGYIAALCDAADKRDLSTNLALLLVVVVVVVNIIFLS